MPQKNDDSKNLPEVYDKVIPMQIAEEMRKSFLAYSMSVITSRALPDVRDGLKPVHRRILFAMYKLGVHSNAKFVKSARIVGDVIGKYHPHGDTAVYDAMVGTAQIFNFRYPLVVGQGNFGSVDGDSAAAMRYTEAKMSKIAGELLRDLEKDTVDWRPNYDDTRKEPSVLPASVPNLLLNGTLGIAVGMATNIPPHNLTEVVNATIHLIHNPQATTEDLLTHISGPDFPTGGVIYGAKDLASVYSQGRGAITVRGETEIIEDTKGGKDQIIITSIPYRVNRANLLIKIAELVQDKKLVGIRDIRDESTEETRIVIELKTGVSPQRIVNYIYKHTDLENRFNMNMVALVEGIPQQLSLVEMLENFVSHREVVVKRRSEHDLRKAQARAHILEGLKKALDHIDEVIQTIKKSKDTQSAKVNLMEKFKFSDLQAQAILDMKLQRLAGLERQKIEDELKEVMTVIDYLQGLLKSREKMLALIKGELLAIRDQYGDERMTKVFKRAVQTISDEDLVRDAEYAVVFSQGGYIKRTDPTEFKQQKRGGVGVVDMDTKEEDVVTHLQVVNSKSDILFFTDAGKVYQMKAYEIPEGRRATRGKSIKNFIQITEGENVTSILAMPKDVKESSVQLMLVTKNGTIKKMSGDSFKQVRRSGLIAVTLAPKDELLDAHFVNPKDQIILSSQKGQAIRFEQDDVRAMGRTAGGVRGMKLGKSDCVVGFSVVPGGNENSRFLVVTQNGYGKMSLISEYKVQKRGGTGIKTSALTEKTGALVSAHIVAQEEELIAISDKSQVIRITIQDVPTMGRATQGVRVMKLRSGDNIASITLL